MPTQKQLDDAKARTKAANAKVKELEEAVKKAEKDTRAALKTGELGDPGKDKFGGAIINGIKDAVPYVASATGIGAASALVTVGMDKLKLEAKIQSWAKSTNGKAFAVDTVRTIATYAIAFMTCYAIPGLRKYCRRIVTLGVISGVWKAIHHLINSLGMKLAAPAA